MAVKSKLLKICNILLSAVLSLILTIFCIALPLYYSVNLLTETEGIVKIAREIDYEGAIKSNKTVEKALAKHGISAKEADDVIKSPDGEAVLEQYAPKVAEIINAFPENGGFGINSVRTIANDNIDWMIDVIEDNTKLNVSRELAKKQIEKTIQDNEEVIESVAPQADEIISNVKMVYKITENSLSVWIGIAIGTVAFFVAFYIVLLRKSSLNGLLWVAVILAFSAVILAVIILYGEKYVADFLTKSITGFYSQLVGTVISLCNDRLQTGFSVIAFLSVSLFSVYGILRKKLNSDKAE